MLMCHSSLSVAHISHMCEAHDAARCGVHYCYAGSSHGQGEPARVHHDFSSAPQAKKILLYVGLFHCGIDTRQRERARAPAAHQHAAHTAHATRESIPHY
jgi:hypothetical protein